MYMYRYEETSIQLNIYELVLLNTPIQVIFRYTCEVTNHVNLISLKKY